MAKNGIEQLKRRIELLEIQLSELRTVNERLKHMEELLFTTKDILNMREVSLYLGISQSLLYKLTCNGEIPHYKPRGKMIFFEKKELIAWIKNSKAVGSDIISPNH